MLLLLTGEAYKAEIPNLVDLLIAEQGKSRMVVSRAESCGNELLELRSLGTGRILLELASKE